ncbi:MAG TPA: 4-phosphoerythronate dehydrogenase [Gammaproteobacteria bacterium]|nr:4-phosphoerythronate dehydrogenase [Gammaproteobacteria bacterium]
MKIIADTHIPYVKEYFDQQGELILKPGRIISHHDVKKADMLLVRSITPVNQALLASSKVKFIGSVTAGADHLDTKWLNEKEILWRVATGFNAPPVADYVVCVIAALQRKGLLLNQHKKAAVIGVGHVGRLVVERLQSLDFDVICVDPIRAEIEKDFISTSLEKITDVDLVSLHVPLTRQGKYSTDQLINKNFLKNQKIDCILLNTSRGAVIHTDDLKTYGRHCHWCFDVWPNEPHIDKTILADALIATPHMAGYAVQSKIRGIAMIYQAAVEMSMIQPRSNPTVMMPQQRLSFKGRQQWQDIALKVFNPMAMTTIMQEVLLKPGDTAAAFDTLRNEFNNRHEFTATPISCTQWQENDKILLNRIGFKLI